MADEIVKILKVDTGESQQTVKGLKKEIADLRDYILNLEEGSKDYDKAVTKLQEDQRKLDQTMSLTKKTATALDGSYDALTHKMSELKKLWRATNDEAKRNELGKQINEINNQLKELDATTGNFQRNVGDYTNSIVDAFDQLNQEIGEYQNKAAQAYQTGDAKAYADAIQEIGKRQGVLDQITKDSEFMNGSLEKRMQNLTGIAEGIAGGFAAVQGIIALTGNESEEFEKTMVKLSAAMSLVQGAQGIQGLIGGLKGFKVAIKASCAGLSTFKKALISTGIGAIVVLIGTLVANWKDMVKWIEKSVGSLDKFRAVFAGIANTMQNYFSNLFKAIGKALTGHFKEAGDLLKDAFDFAGAYAEGAAKKEAKIAQDAARAKAEAAWKEADDYIKDQEAKLGADWKFSEEGIKAYRQMFDEKLKMYDKDTDEWKDAQREKWKFEKELADKLSGGKGTNVSHSSSSSNDLPEIEIGDIEDANISVPGAGEQGVKLSNGASHKAAIELAAREREMKKALAEASLLDEEKKRQKELEITEEYSLKRLEILKKYAELENDPEEKMKLIQQMEDLELEMLVSGNDAKAAERQRDLDNLKMIEEQKKQVVTETMSAISTILAGMANIYQQDLDNQLAAGKISEEEYEKHFKKVKAMQIAEATINTIAGVIGTFMGISKDTGGWGIALAAIKAAAVAAQGAMQIAQIKKTTPGASNVERGMVSPPTNIFQETPLPTHNITGKNETDELNKDQRVYILESDIQESAKRVEIRESERSF